MQREYLSPELEVFEVGIAEEFAQDGVVGDKMVVNGQEPFQEGEQALGLDVLGGAVGDLAQQRFDEGLEDRQLVDQRRVEHHVGVFLEGKDITLLAPADGVPAFDGILGAVAALAGIPDDAADQAGIGGGDAVLVVEVELREGRDIETIGEFGREPGQQVRVQAMDAFQDDDLPGI